MSRPGSQRGVMVVVIHAASCSDVFGPSTCTMSQSPSLICVESDFPPSSFEPVPFLDLPENSKASPVKIPLLQSYFQPPAIDN